MPRARILRGLAPAKINLGLKILARRPDGFHELRTVFQTLALADEVTLTLTLTPGPAAIALELDPASPACATPQSPDNLAWRAAQLAQDAFGLPGAVHIHLRKNIPVGSGLGGGSSDAACVLRLLASTVSPAPSDALLARLAAQLGSDVSPFLLGGTMLGLGRGEEVYPLPELGPWHCVLVMPAGPVSSIATADAFARWDALHPPTLTAPRVSATLLEFSTSVRRVLPAFRFGRNRDAPILTRKGQPASKVHAGIENDFQEVVFSLSQDFPRIHRSLRRAGAVWVGLTGSGAAQFGLFASSVLAQHAASLFAGRDQVWVTRFTDRPGAPR